MTPFEEWWQRYKRNTVGPLAVDRDTAESIWDEAWEAATERAAAIACETKGGYTASLDGDVLVPDKDGPWCLGSEVAARIRGGPS